LQMKASEYCSSNRSWQFLYLKINNEWLDINFSNLPVCNICYIRVNRRVLIFVPIQRCWFWEVFVMTVEILQVIENNHLFSGLNGELIREIAASASKKTLGSNEILFRKGDRANAMWGVLSGRIVTQG